VVVDHQRPSSLPASGGGGNIVTTSSLPTTTHNPQQDTSVDEMFKSLLLQHLNENVGDDCLTRCVQIFEHLLQLRIQLYSESGKQEDLLLIRALLMFYKHPKLCVRNGRWDLLVAMAANEMDDRL
jgi:hypothetical protein